MLSQLRPAIVLTIILTLLTGLIYPLVVTGIAQLAFPGQANSSQIVRNTIVVGSSLIGQNFTAPKYFWSRPSATSPDPYTANASSGSNLGPTSQPLVDRVKASVAALKATGIAGPLPEDAVTTSGSGLDPDISPAYAQLQIARVSTTRSLPVDRVTGLVNQQTKAPILGIFGEPSVNVLALNLALDALASK